MYFTLSPFDNVKSKQGPDLYEPTPSKKREKKEKNPQHNTASDFLSPIIAAPTEEQHLERAAGLAAVCHLVGDGFLTLFLSTRTCAPKLCWGTHNEFLLYIKAALAHH